MSTDQHQESTTTVDVVGWRERCLEGAGFDRLDASLLACDCSLDLHALVELVARGCPPRLAARILAPLDGNPRPC